MADCPFVKESEAMDACGLTHDVMVKENDNTSTTKISHGYDE